MAENIIMPKLGMAMEEGKVIRWLKKEGDKVEKGEPLLEIETDKVNMEVESIASGVLLKIIKGEGEVVPVTETIGYIGQPGEKIEINKSEDKKQPKQDKQEVKTQTERVIKLKNQGTKIPATPLARTLAKEKGIDLRTVKGSGKYGHIKAADVKAVKKIKATPLANRIAQHHGLDISSIKGSGFGGKVQKEDVLDALKTVDTQYQTDEKQAADRKSLQGMRKIIADRMLKSHLEIPAVTMDMKADVTELAELRSKLNNQTGHKFSYNDFILKVVALTLKEQPNMNICFQQNEIIYNDEINIGMAVGLEDGLIVPVIKNADKLSLKQISVKAKELAKKGREKKLLPGEIEGATFTVTNLGMFDVLSFTPIINLPQSAILGVCAIEDQLKMVNDEIKNRKMMGLSLTFDHRVIDGMQAAIFLKRIKSLLENPLECLV